MRHHDVYCLRGTWVEESDFWPYGEPECRVEIEGDLTLGLHIAHPFGEGSDAMLQIRAIELPDVPGGEITLAIGTVVTRETLPLDVRAPYQRNPNRVKYGSAEGD